MDLVERLMLYFENLKSFGDHYIPFINQKGNWHLIDICNWIKFFI